MVNRSHTYFIRICSGLCLLCALANLACGLSTDQHRELTYETSRGEFIMTVEAQGETEAENAHTIVAPMLNWASTQVGWLPPEGTFVRKGEVVVQLEASRIKRAYASALNELDIARADAEKGMAELTLEQNQLESQLQTTQAALKSAKLQLARMSFEPPRAQEIRRLEIAQHELELEKIQNKLASNKRIQEEERTRLQLKVKQAESKVEQARFQLSQLQLIAPVDGFVQYAKLWSGDKVALGTQLWPHMPIVNIPDLSVMQVKLQLTEHDAQRLRKGDLAKVRIPSLGDLLFTGKVSRVEKMAKAVRKNRKTTKVKRVEVIVELDSTHADLVPGLTAQCVISVDRLEDVITVPQECVFDTDSLKVVYVQEESDFVPHAVSIAKYGEDLVAIYSGLEGGERCSLLEPPASRIRWPEKLALPQAPVTDEPETVPPSDSSETKKLSTAKTSKLSISDKIQRTAQ